jgi:hypothetical protein
MDMSRGLYPRDPAVKDAHGSACSRIGRLATRSWALASSSTACRSLHTGRHLLHPQRARDALFEPNNGLEYSLPDEPRTMTNDDTQRATAGSPPMANERRTFWRMAGEPKRWPWQGRRRAAKPGRGKRRAMVAVVTAATLGQTRTARADSPTFILSLEGGAAVKGPGPGAFQLHAGFGGYEKSNPQLSPYPWDRLPFLIGAAAALRTGSGESARLAPVLRLSSPGFATVGWGVALEGGPSFRLKDLGSVGPFGEFIVGVPFGLQASVWAERAAGQTGAGVAVGVDVVHAATGLIGWVVGRSTGR